MRGQIAGNQVPGNKASIKPDNSAAPVKEEFVSSGGLGKRLFIYAVILAVFGLLFIVAAIAIDYANTKKSEVVKKQFVELRKQQDLEKKKLRIEADALRKERDFALTKIKQEKDRKEKADELAAVKLAVEQAAIAAETTKKKESKNKNK